MSIESHPVVNEKHCRTLANSTAFLNQSATPSEPGVTHYSVITNHIYVLKNS